mgnify:CR=1 FL=1
MEPTAVSTVARLTAWPWLKPPWAWSTVTKSASAPAFTITAAAVARTVTLSGPLPVFPTVAPLAPSTVQIGAIRYDKDSGALYLNGEVMELTPRELALMHALLAQPGHAVTKERLYELVFPGQLDVQYEAIEVVVYRLRRLGYLLRADT